MAHQGRYRRATETVQGKFIAFVRENPFLIADRERQEERRRKRWK
jgi:hypothetical protein